MDSNEMMASFPSGLILAWYATGGEIPQGWAICDGSNNTPDLRGRFLRGVSDFADVGRQMGSETHNHSVSGRTTGEVEGHYGGPEGADNGSGGNWSHKHNFHAQTNQSANIPPSTTVLFIMKT